MTLIDQAGRGCATSRYLDPPLELAPLIAERWIQCYTWEMRSCGEGWRIAPDAQPHLIVHRRVDGSTRGPILIGARTTWLDVRVAERAWSAGVTLRPGALPAFTGMAGGAFTNLAVPAEEVWGPRGVFLTEAVAAVDSADEASRVLLDFVRESALGTRTPIDWRVRGFVSHAGLHTPGGAPVRARVSEIAAAIGVSTRALRDTWRRDVGLAPRDALSIGRLHRAVRRALAGPPTLWSHIAHDAGFYDQAHLIREFRRLLGETPERFLGRGG